MSLFGIDHGACRGLEFLTHVVLVESSELPKQRLRSLIDQARQHEARLDNEVTGRAAWPASSWVWT